LKIRENGKCGEIPTQKSYYILIHAKSQAYMLPEIGLKVCGVVVGV
jgi:hypothetical protein